MTREFAAGNYRFIPAVFQYSGGAAADPDYEIKRVRFDRLLPLAEGFVQAARFIREAGRPLTAFCACELRSPAAFTEEGFRAFNLHYVKTLAEWGIFDGTTNPVARSNVCPEIDPPSEPSFHAFSFTRATRSNSPSFVIAGGAEAREGTGSYVERTVRYRDLSPEGLREKVRFTTSQMETRMAAFGFGLAADDECAGLFGARLPSCVGRRTGPPRRTAFGPDLALRAAARHRSRI
jgi:hypothetical protein